MKHMIKGLIGTAAASLLSSQAFAGLAYNQDVSAGVLMGNGISNGSWTIDKQNNIEIALRGKLRFNNNNQPENTYNSNGDGTYSFNNIAPPTGFSWASNSPSTSIWNFEWSVDTSGTQQNANNYGYSLSVDYDPSMGTNFFSYDPINIPNDNGGNNFVQQNSWNMQFLNHPSLSNPFMNTYKNTDHGTYDFVFSVFDKNSPNNILASTRMQIIQGDGGTVNVSAPPVSALFAMGLLGLGLARRRSQS